MPLTVQFGTLADVAADWLVLTILEDAPFSEPVQQLDSRMGGILARLRQSNDLRGKPMELTPIYSPQGIAATRVLVVGLGKQAAAADRAILFDAAAGAARAITTQARKRVALAIPEVGEAVSSSDVASSFGAGFWQALQGPGLRKSEATRFEPEEVVLVGPASASQTDIRQAARRAEVEGNAIRLAKELVNLPPCDLYPETFAVRARQVAKSGGFECVLLDEKQLEAERMHALLAVAAGSVRPPRLVVLRYGKQTGQRTLGLVGKGVTFDSGGLSLKTSEQMLDMKCDMAGAAAVLAAIQAIAALAIPVNVLGVMPLVENMPGSKAYKLGDVLRTRRGKTIEVLNTDAEGRLILADALAYAVDYKADHLVDLATLTGACMVALGTEVAGLMGNNEAWCGQVRDAAKRAGEKAWQLPMLPHYGELIKSNVADMKNTGGTRYGGAITAAKLLEQFVGDVPWVHLDIAGPAWAEHESSARDAGGTGCFVRTLIELARAYGAEGASSGGKR